MLLGPGVDSCTSCPPCGSQMGTESSKDGQFRPLRVGGVGRGRVCLGPHVRMMSFYQGLLPTLDQLSDRPRVSGMADELRMLRAALNGWMDATVRRDGVSKDESDEWVLLSAANLFCLRVVFKPSLLTLTYTSPGPVPVRRSLYSFGSGRHLAPASGILVPSTCF